MITRPSRYLNDTEVPQESSVETDETPPVTVNKETQEILIPTSVNKK